MASKAGGGIKSRQVVRPGVRTGQPAKEKFVRGVSQIGQSLGDHITERRGTVDPREPVRGGPLSGSINVKLGNQTAKECAAGPGGGRVVHARGSQGQHGASVPGNPPAKNRDTLAEFGRESPNVAGRK